MNRIDRQWRAGKRWEQQQEIARLRALGVTVVDATSLPSGVRCELRGTSVHDDIAGRMQVATDACEEAGEGVLDRR